MPCQCGLHAVLLLTTGDWQPAGRCQAESGALLTLSAARILASTSCSVTGGEDDRLTEEAEEVKACVRPTNANCSIA